MPTEDNWNEAARRLTVLTELGAVSWDDNRWSPTIRDGVVGDGVYGALYTNKWLMVYEYRYKAYIDEDRWDWQNDVAVEFVNEHGDLQWRWPKIPYRIRLLDAIRCKAAGADSFLKQLLRAKIPDE